MPDRVLEVLRILSKETRRGLYEAAAVYGGPPVRRRTPWRTLVGCLISQRVRDEQTSKICEGLFAVVQTPEEILRLPLPRLHRLIHAAGFYRQKAKHLRAMARAVIENGGVPSTREELLQLPGIGPKCANIVLSRCFGQPWIAVDTHVHRISNRLGWVRTKTPEQTEPALTAKVPIRWRRRVNVLLVAHGQVICRPIGPRCDDCPVRRLCPRRGV